MTQEKHTHHFLPRLYLKGFASESDPSHIWEYERLRKYSPGSTNRSKYNPVYISLRKAGATIGEYACLRSDGTVDFNTYEDALERLEKPADSVFRKLRGHEELSDSDREVFAAYMATMTRRVPARKDLVSEQFPDVLKAEEERINKLFEDELARVDPSDSQGIAVLRGRLDTCRKIFEDYKQNGMPREIELRTIVDAEMPQVRAAMIRMTWQFFVASEDNRFVTGDNPVHTIKGGVGFSKPYSELTFPISSRLVLIGTYRSVTSGYFTAQTELVKEVNRRLIASAKTYVYSSQDRKWVMTVMNKKFHKFNLYYPAPELDAPIPV